MLNHAINGYHMIGEEGLEIFDDLENLEPSFSDKIKMTLVYVVGDNTRKPS